MNPIFEAILGPLFKIIDKAIPDKSQQDAVKAQILVMEKQQEAAELEASVKLALGQLDVNKQEASGNWYQSGWRPTAGYVCVAGFGYQFLLQPFLTWYSLNNGGIAPPTLDVGDLMTVLLGMLGLGTLRTYEKKNGVGK